jgi:hypothetical protein
MGLAREVKKHVASINQMVGTTEYKGLHGI